MSNVFSQLVNGPDDFAGALAYVVYKKSKMEWRDRFVAANAREPSDQEVGEFVELASLPSSLRGYTQQGDILAAEFARRMFERKAAELTYSINQSELVSRFAGLEATVVTALSRIEKRIDERKTAAGWARDIGTSLISGIGLILILGAMLGGYKMLTELTESVKTTTGVAQ